MRRTTAAKAHCKTLRGLVSGSLLGQPIIEHVGLDLKFSIFPWWSLCQDRTGWTKALHNVVEIHPESLGWKCVTILTITIIIRFPCIQVLLALGKCIVPS
jgi:hypothetical protein